MPKNVKSFRWVRITEEQYQKAMDMAEPDARPGTPKQFEPVSLVAGFCIEMVSSIPYVVLRAAKENPHAALLWLNELEKNK
jgi:hypothetical protein